MKPQTTENVPLNPVVRGLLFALGIISLVLASVTVVIRGIPTTPFLLMAVACFSHSSPRMHSYITNHKVFGPFLADLKSGRGMSIKAKVRIFLIASLSIGLTAVFLVSALWLRIFLFSLIVVKAIVLIWIIPTKQESTPNELLKLQDE